MKKIFDSEDFAYILGVIGGDGTIFIKNKKQYTLSISDKNKEFHIDVIKRIFLKLFDFKISIEHSKKRNTWYSVVRSKSLVTLFNKFYSAGKGKTYRDRIPKHIMRSNDESVILSHIGGWIDSEGTSFTKTFHTKYGIYSYPCIKIELVNKGILEDLSELCKKTRTVSTKVIYAKRNYRKDQKPRYYICWNGCEKCSKLAKYIRNKLKKERLILRISSSKRPI